MKAPSILLLTRIATLVCLVAAGTQSSSTARLQVHMPSTLSKTGGYELIPARFGLPYEASGQWSIQAIAYNLKYGANSLSDLERSGPVVRPFIAILSRPKNSYENYGNAPDRYEDVSYVAKVREAQAAGASAVLFVDTICLCSSTDCILKDRQGICQDEPPVLSDDGSGADISIPSFLVHKHDADKLLLLNNDYGSAKFVEISFSGKSNTPVEYQLWTTPADESGESFFTSFKQAALALDRNAVFTPRMFLHNGTKIGCHTGNGNNCEALCTNGGRYCAMDHGDPDTGISGIDVVAESLRRICVWNIYGTDGIGKPWWDYVEAFSQRCGSSPELFISEKCITEAMNDANIDKPMVLKCMRDSGGLAENQANSLLDLDLKARKEAGPVLIPSMFINQASLNKRLTFASVFRAICSEFNSGFGPSICGACYSCFDQESCVKNNGRCPSSEMAVPTKRRSIGWLTIFISVFLGLSLAFVAMRYESEGKKLCLQMLADKRNTDRTTYSQVDCGTVDGADDSNSDESQQQ